jgi:hypothetical protein
LKARQVSLERGVDIYLRKKDVYLFAKLERLAERARAKEFNSPT